MNRITLLAAAGLAVAVAGTGLAAADAVTSTPTYHGCVVGTSRTLERVYTSKTPTCPSGSFAANWNQTGPRGPQGIQGPQGPAGPSTAGPTGLDTVTEYASTTGNQTAGGMAYVTCPAGHPYAISGGGGGAWTQNGIAPVANSAPMIASYPTFGNDQPQSSGLAANGWFVDFGFTPNGQPVGTVTAYAICAK